MMKHLLGKIILVDDDVREKRLVELALNLANWDVHVEFYNTAKDALKSLHRTAKEKILLIISDMNMEGMNGIEFKDALDKEHLLNDNSIPFIIASSTSSEEQIAEAYHHNIQGFFSKPISLDEQANILDAILKYWSFNRYPC
jgi:DNA-binding NtrC family response regulator